MRGFEKCVWPRLKILNLSNFYTIVKVKTA